MTVCRGRTLRAGLWRRSVGLGLVVRNVGTLYRLRYPFWVLLAILGAGGAAHLFSEARARKYAVGKELYAVD